MKRAMSMLAVAFGLPAAAPTVASAAQPGCVPYTQRVLASGLGSLENLEFDGGGGMFLSASQPKAIQRLTRNGHVSTVVPNVASPGGLRKRGRFLYFNTGDSAQSGVLGLSDGTLSRYDLVTHRVTVRAPGLTMPNGLVFLPGGDAVVSRDLGSGTGITRIRAKDPRHPWFGWANLDDTNGLAVDPTGRWLYVDQTFTADSAVYRISIAEPHRMSVVATLGDAGVPKGLDDLTIGRRGDLYLAANGAGQVIRLNPRTGARCVIASGLMNPSSLKFGRGRGWPVRSLYVTSFDGTVRELTPPRRP
jgi:sugar lactone lactonase YvrE